MELKVSEKVSVPLVVGVAAASLLVPSTSLGGLLSLLTKRSFVAGVLTATAIKNNTRVTIHRDEEYVTE